MLPEICMRENFVPRAVVFDMDGLMFDSEREVQYAWDVTGEEMGYGKLGHNIYHTLGLNKRAREAYFKEKYGQDFPYEEFQERYRSVVYEHTKQQGSRAKPGLYELLESLAKRGIPMAVATSSSPEHAALYLKNGKISGYFQTVVTGNMVTKAKPDPQIYQIACEKLGVKPEEALALEDSYNGLRSAHRAGMKAVMVPDLLKDPSPVEDIIYAKAETLLEVKEMFGW